MTVKLLYSPIGYAFALVHFLTALCSFRYFPYVYTRKSKPEFTCNYPPSPVHFPDHF